MISLQFLDFLELGMRCVIVDDQGIVPFNASFEASNWIRTDLDAEEQCKMMYGYSEPDCLMWRQDNFTCLVYKTFFSKYIRCGPLLRF